MTERKVDPRVVLRGLLLLVSLALLAGLAEWLAEAGVLSERWMDAQVAGQGGTGYALFVGVGMLATAVGFPRQVIAFLAGYAFGAAAGTALALLATVAGCVASFAYARILGRSLVARRFPGRVRKVDELLGRHPFRMTMIVRLLPVGNNLLTNLLAGVSRVGAPPFVAGSAVGYLPQTLAFALAGSGIAVDPAIRVVLAIALFIASAVLGISLYRSHRQGAELEDDIDRALAGDEQSQGGTP